MLFVPSTKARGFLTLHYYHVLIPFGWEGGCLMWASVGLHEHGDIFIELGHKIQSL